MEGPWDQTSPSQDLQSLQRPELRGQADRRGGPVYEPTRRCHRALIRREVPDPGPRPHSAEPPPEEEAPRGGRPPPSTQPPTPPPPFSPPSMSSPVSSSASASLDTATRSSWPSCA